MATAHKYDRYQRQLILKGFGIEAQEKLSGASVLVAGAGGLGCPALQYLAAAGVGTIGIVDDDVVAISNLHRQVLYNMQDIGRNKAVVAAEKLQQLNSDIHITPYNLRLKNENALAILGAYDIVIDGTDNFATRYLINDACVLLSKPFVYGAVSTFEGQVAVFNVNTKAERGVHYRDLFPHPPAANQVLNCAEAGVLGVLPGVIGTMQANEAIKYITGIGTPLAGKLLTWNALDNSFYELHLTTSVAAHALIPKSRVEFLKMDYNWLCGAATTDVAEVDMDTFNELIGNTAVTIIDVREKDEQPAVDEFVHLKMPLTTIRTEQPAICSDTIVVFCQSGKRSLQAAAILNEHFHHTKKIYSLKNGIPEWKRKYVGH